MLQKTRQSTRKWLTLLFVAGFLLNIQASYACAMMPDMAQDTTECCCGASHRMEPAADAMVGMDHGIDSSDGQHGHGPLCDDPHNACCIVEVSVGINDPPTEDQGAIIAISKLTSGKLFKQLDAYFPVVTFNEFVNKFDSFAVDLSAKPTDPYLHLHPPPLYKTTARYRI